MNRLILTGSDTTQAELLALTAPELLRYAIRHQVDFKSVRKYDPEIHPMWHKIPLILEHLALYDQVIWIDADMLVTNADLTPWTDMNSGIHMSRDWGPDATNDGIFTTACMVVNRDAASILMLAERNREEWQHREFHEMAYLRSIYPAHQDKFHIHPRRVLNPVPVEVSPDAAEPWQPGDWLCHFTMIPVEKRIELVKGFINNHSK